MSTALPQLSGRPVVNDGGLETDLIYHHGVDLPDFAAFPLVDDDRGRELLLRYYGDYVDIARRAGAAVQLDTPTWRASADWGDRLGFPVSELRRVNRDAVALIDQLRSDVRTRRIRDQWLPRTPRRRLRRRRGCRPRRRRRVPRTADRGTRRGRRRRGHGAHPDGNRRGNRASFAPPGRPGSRSPSRSPSSSTAGCPTARRCRLR